MDRGSIFRLVLIAIFLLSFVGYVAADPVWGYDIGSSLCSSGTLADNGRKMIVVTFVKEDREAILSVQGLREGNNDMLLSASIDGGAIWRCRLGHAGNDVYYCPIGHDFISDLANGVSMVINVGRWTERIPLKGSNSALRTAASGCFDEPIIEPAHKIDL